MLDHIYPEEEQCFFTDREHYLELLGLSRDLLLQGIRKHLALSGFRRVGKTLILKEFLRRHLLQEPGAPVALAFVDLPRLAFTPEAFATQYIGSILHWLAERDEDARIERYYDPAFQLIAAGRWNNRAVSDYLYAFGQELQKERPDQHLLLEMAFNWPETWARATGHHVMLILDEFPDILALNNYPQIDSVVALFRAVLQSQSRVCYVVAGSMLSLMERLFLGADSPLFVHFQLETVGPFGREDSYDLTRRRLLSLDPSPSPEVLAAVYQVTRGHPLYIAAISRTRIVVA